MKIAIVGSGAVGCHYGGLLRKAGLDVRFLMRRDCLFVRHNGLCLRSPEGETRLHPVQAMATTAEIGVCDLVLITVKTFSNGDLPDLLPPLIGKSTILLTLQNGLGNEAFLSHRFGPERIMGGICFVTLNRVAPGVVENYSPGYVVLGEPEGPPRERTQRVASLFRSAGIKCRVAESLLEARWKKLCWNIPFNGLTVAAGGIDTAAVLADPGLTALAGELMEEIRKIAAALGIVIGEDFLKKQIEQTRPMGPYKPSSLLDYLDGREMEVESIWGEPCAEAERLGVPVPRLAMLLRLLRVLSRQRLPHG